MAVKTLLEDTVEVQEYVKHPNFIHLQQTASNAGQSECGWFEPLQKSIFVFLNKADRLTGCKFVFCIIFGSGLAALTGDSRISSEP